MAVVLSVQLLPFRHHCLESEDRRCNDFQVSLLGGAWTSANKGVIADAFSAKAKDQQAISFCAARHMARSARFEISLYTEEWAAALARCWCHRMQFLLNLSLEHQNVQHIFTQAELDAWVEPSELASAEMGLWNVPRARRRILEIRSLR